MWNVDAPRAEVFRILNTPDQQQHWWPSRVMEHAEPMPELPGGLRTTLWVLQAPSVRRIAPPFILHTTMSAVEQDLRTRVVVTGDLAGVLDTLNYDRPDGGTRIIYPGLWHKLSGLSPQAM
jgi:uncharacterized protein YndB with AHSA1/START domain